MAIRDALRQVALRELSLRDLYSMDSSDLYLFKHLYNENIIDDVSIEGSLEKAVIERARKDYRLAIRTGNDVIFPDHFLRPEIFAYALSKKVFSDRELNKVRFDHGENPEIFQTTYGKDNLLATLREELLNPKPLPKFSSGDDCVLCCHH